MSWFLIVGGLIGFVVVGFAWALLTVAALADRKAEEWLSESDARRVWRVP